MVLRDLARSEVNGLMAGRAACCSAACVNAVVVAGQLARRGVRRLPRSWAALRGVVAAELWVVVTAELQCRGHGSPHDFVFF